MSQSTERVKPGFHVSVHDDSSGDCQIDVRGGFVVGAEVPDETPQNEQYDPGTRHWWETYRQFRYDEAGQQRRARERQQRQETPLEAYERRYYEDERHYEEFLRGTQERQRREEEGERAVDAILNDINDIAAHGARTAGEGASVVGNRVGNGGEDGNGRRRSLIFGRSFWKGLAIALLGIVAVVLGGAILVILGMAMLDLWMVYPEVAIAVVVAVVGSLGFAATYAGVREIRYRKMLKERREHAAQSGGGLPGDRSYGAGTGFAPAASLDRRHP